MTAVADDGRESFFTETVENWHPLIARFGCVDAASQSGSPLLDSRGTDCTMGVESLTVTFADQSPIDNQETPVA